LPKIAEQTSDTLDTTTLFQRPLDEINAGNANSKDRAASQPAQSEVSATAEAISIQPARTQPERSPTGRAGRWLSVVLFLLIASAVAFYGGIRYQQNKTAAATDKLASATLAPTPAPVESNYEIYEKLKTAVNAAPNAQAQRMAGENGGRPMDSSDPVFLTLYGRALFLSGRYPQAVEALKLANEKIDAGYPPGRDPVRLDARMMLAAAALRTGESGAMSLASDSLVNIIEEPSGAPATENSMIAAPSPTP
jgi:cytochrome c-type biogenesis protein CcmH/NrfG